MRIIPTKCTFYRQTFRIPLYLGRLVPMRRTHSLVRLLHAFGEDPTGHHWGYNLSKRSGLRSGVLYPILHRMLDEGWLTDGWEEPVTLGRRPPRRYYQLTPDGLSACAHALEAADQDAAAVIGGLLAAPPPNDEEETT